MDKVDICMACPRGCRVDRKGGELGFCRVAKKYAVSSALLHRGEEPVVSGKRGICNVFFSHCNLQCIYCQNYQISRNTTPLTYMRMDEIISMAKEARAAGSDGIGLVSPSHMIEEAKEIILALRREGLALTTVFNTNGYDKRETIESLSDLIDVYLPDFKYMDEEIAFSYSGARDYPKVALGAIKEMYKQKGPDIALNEKGTIKSGLIIRHLILPGSVENSSACLRAIAEELSPSVYISLMSQYCPTPAVKDHPKLSRPITKEEYDKVLEELERLGFHNGWLQELESKDSYKPDFSRENPFE